MIAYFFARVILRMNHGTTSNHQMGGAHSYLSQLHVPTV